MGRQQRNSKHATCVAGIPSALLALFLSSCSLLHDDVLCAFFLVPQPYLKFHNPRTFEDMDKPIPNFKKFGLKSGATLHRFTHQQHDRRWYGHGM